MNLPERLRQAVGALATSHLWQVVHDVRAEDGYPKILWQYADAAATDAPIGAGRHLTLEESHGRAAGRR